MLENLGMIAKPKKQIIALVGTIGAGKTLILQNLEEMGFPVLSADKIYAELFEEKQYQNKLKQAFPEFKAQKRIEKKQLRELVFDNKEKLYILNELAHKIVLKRIKDKANKFKADLVFVELSAADILNITMFHRIIEIYTDYDEIVKRVKSRDNRDEESIKKVYNIQKENLNKLYSKNLIFARIRNDDSKRAAREVAQIINY